MLQLDANEHVAELLKDTLALPVEGGESGEPEEAPRELSSRIQASESGLSPPPLPHLPSPTHPAELPPVHHATSP